MIDDAEAERNAFSILTQTRHKFTEVTQNLTGNSATIFVEQSHVVGGDLALASCRDASPLQLRSSLTGQPSPPLPTAPPLPFFNLTVQTT